MAQAINEPSRIADIKIRAVPSEGQYLNTTHIARDVAELFTLDIEGSLHVSRIGVMAPGMIAVMAPAETG